MVFCHFVKKKIGGGTSLYFSKIFILSKQVDGLVDQSRVAGEKEFAQE